MSAPNLHAVACAADAVLARLRAPLTDVRPRTGLDDLDHVTGGLHAGELWALTGQAGAGKTLLALGWARSVALSHGGRAVLLSRRESPTDLAELTLSAESKVALHHLRSRELSEPEWSRLELAHARLGGAPLEFALTSDPFQAARSLPAVPGQSGPALVVVDDVAPGADRLVQLHDLKELAGQLGATVVAVLADDAREVGAAEREAAVLADVVMRLEDHSANPERAGEADLVLTHHRRGPTATIVLHNQAFYARFVSPPR